MSDPESEESVEGVVEGKGSVSSSRLLTLCLILLSAGWSLTLSNDSSLISQEIPAASRSMGSVEPTFLNQ